jgi:antitoxin MazE
MAHIIQVGNSFGVRIPKAIIQQLGFKEDTNLVFKVTQEGLLIKPEKQAREGWEQKFKATKKRLKNPTLLGEFPNEFDEEEWVW